MNRLFFNITIVHILLLTACSNKQTTEATSQPSSQEIVLTPQQTQNAKITLGAPSLRNMQNNLTLKGVLDVPPQSMLTISPPYGGYLKQTKLMPGTHVHRGEIIAVLEHPDYIQLQQDFLDAKAKLELFNAEYSRQQQLAKENINAQKNVQQVTTELQIIKNQIEALTQKLALINISAEQLSQTRKISRQINLITPITGYVQSVKANIGKYIQPADVLFEIVDTRHMHIALTAFEKDINTIQIGQKLTFTLPNNDPHPRTGSIHLIAKTINPDKSIPIHAHIDRDDAKLLPGMFVTAVLQTTSSKVITLPKNAVVNNADKNYIFLQNSPNHYVPVEVVTGRSNNLYVEILSPKMLVNAQNIVLSGAYTLYSKWKMGQEQP